MRGGLLAASAAKLGGVFFLLAALCYGQVSVLTQRDDPARDGLNASETALTLSSVSVGNFGKLFNFPVDGLLFAQPLYVAGVAIPANGTHNVVYAATMHDSVYAYDADGLLLQPLWHVNLAALSCPVGFTCSSVPSSANYSQSPDVVLEIGIMGTPVIDPSTNTLYVVAKTQEISGSTTNYVYRLHALDITTGAERTGSPVAIEGQVQGTGAPNNNGFLVFSQQYSLQRPGLALVNNNIYIGFGSAGDDANWHGWIFGYDKSALSQTAAFSTTPNGTEGYGGVWMHGNGLASDAAGYLYFTTGNGAFDGTTNFGDSFLKLATPGLTVADYFTPYYQQDLDTADLDVAAGGLALLPNSAGTTPHPHIMIGCGKNGAIYVVDRDNLGQFNSSNDNAIIQELLNVIGDVTVDPTSTDYVPNCYASPAYWQGNTEGNMYIGGIGDSLKMFSFSNGLLSTSAVSKSPTAYQFPGTSPSVSANGTSNGIVWTIENGGNLDQFYVGTTAILHAYDATNLSSELYNSTEVASDAAGAPVKFTVPTIANGKVYVGTQAWVAVYGLLSGYPQAAAPSFSVAGGTYSNAVTLTITDATAGTEIFYTTDGTTPTTASNLYTGPITIGLTATLNAIAAGGGYRSSLITTASYIINGAGSGINFIQGNFATPQGPQTQASVAYSQAQLAGDLNLVVVGWNDTTATIPAGGVTDSKGRVYTLTAGPTALPGAGTAAIYYANNIAAAGAGANTVTVHFSTAATSPDLRILEYAGANPNTPVDVVSEGTGNSATSTVDITTTGANELIVAGNYVLTSTTGPGTGFTSRMITTPDSDIVEDASSTAPALYIASAPVNPGDWIMQAVALRSTASNAPAVSSLSPSTGAASGGTAVTITGTNFASGATVTFGGTAASNVVVVNGTTITATTPAGSAGAVTVTVTVNGQSGSLINGFTYIGVPTVSSVSPNEGSTAGGTAVTITGTNFASGATVTFGGTAASNVVVVNGTTITATTPAGSAGAVTVTVTNPGSQSGNLANGFTYAVVPTVSSVAPNNGPVAGGTAVTITGTNFASGATVTFGGTAASNVVVVNGTTITATTPAGSAGAVTVTVTVNGQSGSLTSGYTYNGAVAIGFAQVASATPQSPTATVPVAYPAAQTAGDLNVVVVGWNDTTATVQSVKDSGGNNYSLAIGPTSGTALRQSIYYAPTIVGGTNTVTVTFSQAAVAPDVRILEYRGVNAVDVTAGASGSSTTASSGAATTTAANELIFGAATVFTGVTGAGSGFTARIITSPDTDLAEDKVVTTTGSNSATAPVSPSGPWVMQMVTFAAVSGPAPTVSSVSPNEGSTAGGTAVTITGTNFASGATVTFGGTAASNVVVVNGTTITATTPAGSAGAVTVTVTNPGSQSGNLANGFTYAVVPTVSSVAPNNGPVAGGTAVTITGTNFASGATVTFGGTAASNVVVVNGTTITATTPAGSAGAVTVTVTNPGSQSGNLANGFTYAVVPTVSSVAPNNGPVAGGTAVTITGTNFASGATVTFGGTAASNVVVVNGTTITATTPAGSAGAVTVTVTNPGSQSGNLANGFTYAVVPTVSSVAPNNGPVAGGTAVTITGTNFASGATVTFGGTAASNVVVVNGTTITATTPAGSAGAVTVTVTVNGQSGSLTSGYTYNGAVAIGFAQVASATPQSPTATVPVAYPAAQTAGDLNVVVVGWNDTTATVQSVKDSGGNNYSLAIGPTSGTALRQSIYYAPTIVGGTNTVTVTFSQAAVAPDVRILEYRGVNAVDVTAGASGSSTTASSGAATTTAASELIFGAATVFTGVTGAGSGFTARIITSPDTDLAEDKVVTTTGSNSATAPVSPSGPWVMQMVTFAAVSGPAPTVSSVSPNEGSTAGGTAVTITGTNFASGATVTFGGTAASNVVVVNGTTITATTPAGSAGAVTVTVTNPGSQSGNLANGFTYAVVPTVSSVAPNNGPVAGGTAVTITGTNFASGATVTFGGTAASNVVVVNGTTITATTPAGSAGAVTVTVTNPGSQSGNLANGFTYAVVPTVSSVAPNNGPVAGGTAVTITGTNFASGATVTFGGTAASNVVVVNGTTITATTPAGSAGAVTVTVTVNGQSGSLTSGYTYNGAVAIGFAQVASATPQSPTATVPVAYPAAQTAGDLNVVVVGWNDTTATVQSVKDSGGNNYSLAIGPTSGTALRQSIYYAPTIVGGTNTVTVTFSQAAVAPDVRILEYRGVNAVDVTAGASGSSTTASSGAATTTAANELIFGAATVFTGVTGAGSGFTARIITSPDTDLAEDKVVTTTGSNSATAPVSPSGPWVMQMVTFK